MKFSLLIAAVSAQTMGPVAPTTAPVATAAAAPAATPVNGMSCVGGDVCVEQSAAVPVGQANVKVEV